MALMSLRSRSHVKASMVLTRADHLFIHNYIRSLLNNILRVCFWSTTGVTTTGVTTTGVTTTGGKTTGVREIRIHCMYKSNCYKTRLVVLFIRTAALAICATLVYHRSRENFL